jgi:hypothetical protein
MIRTLRLDVRVDVINECADRGNGQHALGHKVSASSNTSHARLPVRRLGGVLARRLEQARAVVHRDDRADARERRRSQIACEP